jgi:hypothetical protein
MREGRIVPGPIIIQNYYPDHIRNFLQLTNNGSLWQVTPYQVVEKLP